MRRADLNLAVGVTLALSACTASTNVAATQVITESVALQGDLSESGVDVTNRRDAVVSEVQAPFDEVFAAMPGALAQLGLSLYKIDEKQGIHITPYTRLRGTLGGMKISSYIDCGQSVMGRTADRYPVSVRVTTAVRALRSEHTVLHIVVQAMAQPDNGGAMVPCTSNGKLEQRLQQLVSSRKPAS